jgi:hypothetical protein
VTGALKILRDALPDRQAAERDAVIEIGRCISQIISPIASGMLDQFDHLRRRRHGITQPLMWWDRVPHDPAALKAGALVMGSKGVARAVPRKFQAQDARALAGS